MHSIFYIFIIYQNRKNEEKRYMFMLKEHRQSLEAELVISNCAYIFHGYLFFFLAVQFCCCFVCLKLI